MSIYPEKIIHQVLEKLDVLKVLELINYRLDTVIQKGGDTVKCFCPIHKEVVFRTLLISQKDKTFKCSYSLCDGNKGGDLIRLYALSMGIDYDEALTRLVNELELDVELPTTQEFIDKTVEVAENYLELSIYDEAERNFLKVLEIQPDNLAARRGLIEVYTESQKPEQLKEQIVALIDALINKKEFDECIKYCEQLLEKEPDNLEVREKLVEAYKGSGNMESFAGELMYLADVYIEKEQYEQALKMYEKIEAENIDIIDIHPHITQVLVALGRTEEAVEKTIQRSKRLVEENNLEEALLSYRSVIELDDSRDDIRQEYIKLALELPLTEARIVSCCKIVDELANRGMLTEAAESLEKIREKVPRNIFILEKLIDIYHQQGLRDKEIESQRHLIECLIERREYNQARKLIDEVLKTHPDVAELYLLSAKVEKVVGNIDEAIESYYNAINIFREQNRLEDAIQTYNIIAEYRPDDISIKEAQLHLYIETGKNEEGFSKCQEIISILEERGETQQLVEKIRFALTLVPTSTENWLKLAEVEHSLGNIDSAKEAYFELHKIFLSEKNYTSALTQLQKILDIDPDDVQALRAMAQIQQTMGDELLALKHYKRVADILFEKGELQQSEEIYKQVLSISSDDLTALNRLAEIYESTERKDDLLHIWQKLVDIYRGREAYGRVIEVCERIIGIDRDNIFALQNIATAYENTQRVDEAIEYYFRMAEIYEVLEEEAQARKSVLEKILALQPNNERARQEMVFLLLESGEKENAIQHTTVLIDQLKNAKNYDSAIKFLNQLLQRDPESESYHLMLLDIFEQAGKIKQFIAQGILFIDILRKKDRQNEIAEWYRKFLHYEPDNISFRLNLIESLLAMNRIDETVNEYHVLAEWYEQNENHEDAIDTYKKLLEIAPADERAHYALIRLYKEDSEYELATQQIKALAELYQKQNSLDKAIQTLEMVFEYSPEDVSIHRAIIDIAHQANDIERILAEYSHIYDIYYRQGKYEEAADVQREAIKIRPVDPSLRTPLIKALISAQQTKSAVEELFNLSGIYDDRQQYDQVLQVCSQILELDPNNIRARRLKAQTFLNLGNKEKALGEFMQITALIDELVSTKDTERVAIAVEEPRMPPPLAVMKEYTFENFVVGEHNHFAYATAMSVARAPAKNYNPLFIFADVGLGKTHLLHAIANYTRENMPELQILYTSAEAFTTELVNAIQNNRVNEFRHKYSSVDILLLDDVHFLAGKERAQEEFFHIFNTLFQAKKQIVVTSDRPPKDISHLEKRLKSRFGSGVIVDIQAPEFETRLAILKKELSNFPEMEIGDNIITLIAERIEWNVRELKAALNQVVALKQTGQGDINAERVSQLLDSLFEKV